MANEHIHPRTSFIAAGEEMPDFTLTTQTRADFKLSTALEKGDVVLCFFPLAFTGTCGTEMECISKDMAKWTSKGAQVVGVSCDSTASLKAWAEIEHYGQTFLSDIHRTLCKGLGIYWPDLNVSGRGTVVVSRNAAGKPVVKWSQKREIKNAMNFDEVLRAMS